MTNPTSINGGNNVLPPYASATDPISNLSRGTYNAANYGAAWTDPPGTTLSCSGALMGGGKRKRKTKRRRQFWSAKYKKSINCKRPKGFSQKQHCRSRKLRICKSCCSCRRKSLRNKKKKGGKHSCIGNNNECAA